MINELDSQGVVEFGRLRLLEQQSQGPVPLEVCDQLLGRALELNEVRAEAWARVLRGVRYTHEADFSRAASDLVQASLLFAEINDVEGHVVALWKKGGLWTRIGALDNGRYVLSQGLELARATGLRVIEGILLANLAFTWGSEGSAQQFLELSEQALEIFVELGDQGRQAHVLCNIGGALARLDQLDNAEAAYLKARPFVNPEQHLLTHALVQGGLGEVALLRGDTVQGEKLILEASTFLRAHNMHYDALRQDILLARGYRFIGRLEDAIALYQQVAEQATAKSFNSLRLQALQSVAEALAERGNHRKAYETLNASLKLQTEMYEEESKQRFQILRDANVGSAIAQNRLRSNELAQMNRQLRVAVAELDELNIKLNELARRDPLTDVLNRYGFQEAVTPLLEKLHASRGVAVLWVDINEFKSINDTYGHGVGDEVLKMVANRLSEVARKGDVVSRFGGDEFVLVLDNIDEVEAVWASEKIKRSIENTYFQSSLGPIRVGISLGLSPIHSPDDMERAMHRADAYMYQEKRGTGSWHTVDPETLSMYIDEFSELSET